MLTMKPMNDLSLACELAHIVGSLRTTVKPTMIIFVSLVVSATSTA